MRAVVRQPFAGPRALLRAQSQQGWVGGLEGAVTLLFLTVGFLVASAVLLPAWALMRLAGRRFSPLRQ